jgi:hypothetical protein
MSIFERLVAPSTLDSVRNTVLGYAQAARLKVTDWIVGGTSQQIFESVATALQSFTQIVPQVTRGFASLDTSTDPGDADPYDPANASAAPAEGYLSALGAGTFGTARAGQTFATGFAKGFVTLTNGGLSARTFSPGGLIFTRSTASPDGSHPTYRNVADAVLSAIYTNADGSCTLSAGASLTLPVEAIEAGTASNAPESTLSLTTSLLGCSATNATPVLGSDREDAATYRARCRQAAARLSFGGPSDAVEYFAAKNPDGTPLLNGSGAQVAINRAQVLGDSATGIVQSYYASPSGPASSADVTAANDNITKNAYLEADAMTYLGNAATAQMLVVAGTARVRAGAGVSAPTLAAQCAAAAVAYAASVPIGGYDQTAGSGFVYARDVEAAVRAAVPSLYAVQVSVAASTAIAVGHVLSTTSGQSDWAITVVS